MSHPRTYHGAAILGFSIYVVGGIYGIRKCERFSIKHEKWTELQISADFDEWGYGVTLVALK